MDGQRNVPTGKTTFALSTITQERCREGIASDCSGRAKTPSNMHSLVTTVQRWQQHKAALCSTGFWNARTEQQGSKPGDLSRLQGSKQG